MAPVWTYVGLFLAALTGLSRTIAVEAKRCKGNRYYDELDGGCSKCEKCRGGGVFLNNTIQRKWTEEHGFIDCYPCQECPSGMYREAKDPKYQCNACVLDCKAVNRFESQHCGGSSPGHCGECKPGYKSETLAANDICYYRETTPTPTPSPFKRTTTINESSTTKDENHPPIDTSILHGPGLLIIISVTFALCFAVAFAVWHLRKYFKCFKTDSQCDNDQTKMSHTVYDSGVGFDTESRTVSFAATQKSTLPERETLLSDSGITCGTYNNDLEMDNGPRGELPKIIVVDVEDHQYHGLEPSGSMSPRPKDTFPLYVMEKDHLRDAQSFTSRCLTYASTNVYGGRTEELFTYLKLGKPSYIPKQQLWQSDSISYPDYVYESLKCWMEKSGRDATLQNLCVALDQASFNEITSHLVTMYHQDNDIHVSDKFQHSSNRKVECVVETSGEETLWVTMNDSLLSGTECLS